jgi:hypothetical protein
MRNPCLLMFTIVGVFTALPAVAAERCSIHPTKGMSDAQLQGLAKLSHAKAEKIAVAELDGKGAVSVSSAELEAEYGCLIWSFDLRVAGKSGVQEIQVDAGDGKVLSVKHENPRQETVEASKERTAIPGK